MPDSQEYKTRGRPTGANEHDAIGIAREVYHTRKCGVRADEARERAADRHGFGKVVSREKRIERIRYYEKKGKRELKEAAERARFEPEPNWEEMPASSNYCAYQGRPRKHPPPPKAAGSFCCPVCYPSVKAETSSAE
jgi:hypothetical protein